MRTKPTGRTTGRRSARVIRRQCKRCRNWVLVGVLVGEECPSCTGIQALPLRDASGRLLFLTPAWARRAEQSTKSNGGGGGGEVQAVAAGVGGAGHGVAWLLRHLAEGVAVCASTGYGRAALALIGVALVWVLVVVPYCARRDTRFQREWRVYIWADLEGQPVPARPPRFAQVARSLAHNRRADSLLTSRRPQRSERVSSELVGSEPVGSEAGGPVR